MKYDIDSLTRLAGEDNFFSFRMTKPKLKEIVRSLLKVLSKDHKLPITSNGVDRSALKDSLTSFTTALEENNDYRKKYSNVSDTARYFLGVFNKMDSLHAK